MQCTVASKRLIVGYIITKVVDGGGLFFLPTVYVLYTHCSIAVKLPPRVTLTRCYIVYVTDPSGCGSPRHRRPARKLIYEFCSWSRAALGVPSANNTVARLWRRSLHFFRPAVPIVEPVHSALYMYTTITITSRVNNANFKCAVNLSKPFFFGKKKKKKKTPKNEWVTARRTMLRGVDGCGWGVCIVPGYGLLLLFSNRAPRG